MEAKDVAATAAVVVSGIVVFATLLVNIEAAVEDVDGVAEDSNFVVASVVVVL